MIRNILKYLIPALVLFGVAAPVMAQEPIERIVAIVGREPIMASELAAQIQIAAIQQGIRPETQAELDKMQEDILSQMINERLFLIEAKKDTTINVSNDEVEMAVDQHIARVASQFETEEQFLDELTGEGMTLRQYKKKLRPDAENQLYKQRLIQMKMASISISAQEVADFYTEFKDSIPNQPEAIRLAHILITFQPSGKTEDSVKAIADKVRANIASGADFIALAVQYSTGPGALNGGDLGFISPDDVIDEFGQVAFNLDKGDLSGVVRTPMGFHIIRCEEKSKDKSHLRHILFTVNPTPGDSLLSYKLVDSLINEINGEGDFKELAKIYSADDESRKQGGELGWFALTDLPPSFQAAMKYLEENESIYGPVVSEYGLHILKKLDFQQGRTVSMEDDFDRLKEMAKQSKTGEFVDHWLEEVKKNVYIEIKL